MKKGLLITTFALGLCTLTSCRVKAPTKMTIYGFDLALKNSKYKYVVDTEGEGAYKEVYWSVDKTNIASIDQNGVLTTYDVDVNTDIKITATSKVSKSTSTSFNVIVSSADEYSFNEMINELDENGKYDAAIKEMVLKYPSGTFLDANFDETTDFAINYKRERVPLTKAQYFFQEIEDGKYYQSVKIAGKGATYGSTAFGINSITNRFKDLKKREEEGEEVYYGCYHHIEESEDGSRTTFIEYYWYLDNHYEYISFNNSTKLIATIIEGFGETVKYCAHITPKTE